MQSFFVRYLLYYNGAHYPKLHKYRDADHIFFLTIAALAIYHSAKQIRKINSFLIKSS